ncbi:MAG: apolipoprotein N-acyltransferase, partial [Halocynthiibacter sp.]
VDVARYGWMAPFALVGMAGGMALFWALGFGLARWLGGRNHAPLVLVASLSAAELLRAYVLTGFPWGMIAYIWTGKAPMQIAAIVGPHGLTFITLLVTSGVYWMTGLARARALMLGAGLWAVFIGVSLALQPGAAPSLDGRPTVRLLQPNATQRLKWDPEMIPVYFRRLLDFSAAPGEPDLIVWPETSVPALLERADGLIGAISDAAGDRPVVFGIQRQAEDRTYPNSLAVIDGSGTLTDIYDKAHLVPFGEYIPGGDLVARLGIKSFAAREGFGFAPGPGPQLVDLGPLGTALPLICYEAIFPQDVNAAPERPSLLLQITNDGWFGEISGHYQHLAQARFRAVEQGLPMLRAANTGISAVIDGKGRVLGSLPLNEAGYLDGKVPPPLSPTLYSRTGDWPVLWLLLLLGAVLIIRPIKNSD